MEAQRHVAILPSPAMGHLTPHLELAKRLATHHGFHVSFLVIPTDASAAQSQHLLPPTLPPGLQVITLPHVDVSDKVHDDMHVTTRLCIIVQEAIRCLPSVLRQLEPLRALVVDVFCIDAVHIAKELSVPVYMFFIPSAKLLALSFYFPALDKEVNGVYSGQLGKLLQMPGCEPVPFEDLIDGALDRQVLPIVSRFQLTAGILVNSWEELEPVTLRALRENSFFLGLPAPPVYPIGPLIKVDGQVASTDAECLTWLSEQPPDSVVYISFGSGGTLSREQVTELAWGLEMSKQRFIWVARRPTESSASGAFFGGGGVNDKAEYLPEGFLERTKGVGLVVPSWAPQVAVLSHPSTGGFVTHCGWNSVLESIFHGVPMITWPLYAEQRMNAWMLVEEMGVAIRPVVGPEKMVVGREEIERVVRLVIEGDEQGKAMRERARELQQSAKKALNRGGLSDGSLSCVANLWRT